MVFRAGPRQVRVDLPQTLFATAIAAFCACYLLNARAASSDVQNMLLIEPAAIAGLILSALIVRDTIRLEPAGTMVAGAPLDRPGARVVGSMVLLGAYVFSMAKIGFDLATYLYILANLILLGERRILVLVVLPLAFAAAIVYGLSAISSIPLPLLWRWGR